MTNQPTKLIAIVGPTGSGKSDIAMALARRFGGEILCADSRTLYRGMDIGTAKPSPADQAAVPHALLDVAEPGQTVSVAAFKDLAEKAIVAAHDRNHVPFLVGGSGLFIDSVLYGYTFARPADGSLRKELSLLSLRELSERLDAVDPNVRDRIDMRNPRRIMRAIETAGQEPPTRRPLRHPTLLLGIALNKEVMRRRISMRVDSMLSQGFINEVRTIGETYGWDSEAMTAIGYRAFKDVFLGSKTESEGRAEFIQGDLRLMKKQLTWFRRNPDIRWIEKAEDADTYVRNFLSQND